MVTVVTNRKTAPQKQKSHICVRKRELSVYLLQTSTKPSSGESSEVQQQQQRRRQKLADEAEMDNTSVSGLEEN